VIHFQVLVKFTQTFARNMSSPRTQEDWGFSSHFFKYGTYFILKKIYYPNHSF